MTTEDYLRQLPAESGEYATFSLFTGTSRTSTRSIGRKIGAVPVVGRRWAGENVPVCLAGAPPKRRQVLSAEGTMHGDGETNGVANGAGVKAETSVPEISVVVATYNRAAL